MRARDLIDRLSKDEDDFLRREFLAPVTRSVRIRVRIGGVVCEMGVRRRPRGFEEGWAILKPLSHREADVAREAPLADVKRYLSAFPCARVVAALRHGDTWLGLAAATPEKGVRLQGLAPVALAPHLQLFQTARVRFDGAQLLFEAAERHPMAAWLREQLEHDTVPDALRRSGLTAPERAAYAIQHRLREDLRKPADQRDLERALARAEATFVRHERRGDVLTVTYRVDGAEHTSIVRRGDLTVLTAGICLDGQDSDFDLTSLVSVLREARRND